MNSTEFCIWLEGYLDASTSSINAGPIRTKLKEVKQVREVYDSSEYKLTPLPKSLIPTRS